MEHFRSAVKTVPIENCHLTGNCQVAVFLSYRKLRFHTIKMLREDAHSAQGQMVAEHVFYCFTWKVRCDIMSTKEKQATPKAAFVFLVPLENEQPAQQAVKRVSAGS